MEKENNSLLVEILSIKDFLHGEKNGEKTQQRLTLQSAISMLVENGYPISKSLIYKLTAQNKIPCSRFGKRLIFDRNELINWCKNREDRNGEVSQSNAALIESAGIKTKKSNYGK